MNELWFNAVSTDDSDTPDADTNQSPEQLGDISGGNIAQLVPQKAMLNNMNNLNYALPTIAEGGRDFSRYPSGGLPAINNPDSSEFDPNAEGSRDSLGRVRWGSKDWDKYNSNKSSGDSLSRGVTFGGGGGFGGGGQSVSIEDPMPSQAGLGTPKKFPWLLAGGVLVAAGYYFMVYKK